MHKRPPLSIFSLYVLCVLFACFLVLSKPGPWLRYAGLPVGTKKARGLLQTSLMIGNSRLDYIVIQLGIGALRAVAPASIGYLACCAIWRRWFYLPIALLATAEAAFYLLVYLPRKSRLQSPPRRRPPPLTFEQRQFIFQRCMVAEKTLTSPEFIYPRGWFLPTRAPPRKDDVIDWLLWALFSSTREEIDLKEYEEELEGYVRQIEKYHNVSLVEGRSYKDELHSMRITIDPVMMLHRPLIWYMIVLLVDSFTSISLACLGFKHYIPVERQWRRTFPPRPIPNLLSRSAPPGVLTPYWYRPHTSTSKHPIVFLHGIGIGLFPYVPFFRSIVSGADSDVGIVLPEMMSICMHMTPRSVLSREEMLVSLNILLDSLQDQEHRHKGIDNISSTHSPLLNNLHHPDEVNAGWDRVVLVSHSYGTLIASWILRACVASSLDSVTSSTIAQSTAAMSLSAKISHLILVDPIPILLSNPAVAHNFLYRHPSTVPPPPPAPHRASGVVATLKRTLTNAASPYFPSKPWNGSPSEHGASWWNSSAAAWQLWYFASRDADVARTLFRTFFWAEGGLWREDLIAFIAGDDKSQPTDGPPRNLAVLLAGRDQVVPCEAIREYITRDPEQRDHWVGRLEGGELVAGDEQDLQRLVDSDLDSDPGLGGPDETRSGGLLEVLVNPRLDHAVIFDDAKATMALLEVVRRYVRG